MATKKEIKEVLEQLNITEEEMDILWDELKETNALVRNLSKNLVGWRGLNTHVIKQIPTQKEKDIESAKKKEREEKEKKEKEEKEKIKMKTFRAYDSYGGYSEFKEDNIVKAIWNAWNYESELYIVDKNEKRLLFAPLESNEFNNNLLKDYGYRIIDGKKYRELVNCKNEVEECEWEKCLDLDFIYDKH